MDINSGGASTAATPVTVGVSGVRRALDLEDSVAETELDSAVKEAERAAQADLTSHRGQKVDITA
ncbi:MAG: hypothetical protein V3U18_01995 [Alphaproteobacteria bacterium]